MQLRLASPSLNVALIAVGLAAVFGAASAAHAETWPSLPPENGTIAVPAQEWPRAPGPREVKVYVYYPGGELHNVTARTGLMLSLHNWGGTHATGAPDPRQLADRFNVVAICVDFECSRFKETFQSPRQELLLPPGRRYCHASCFA